MPFPDFEPCTPVFLRSLKERYASRDLIVYEGRRLTYGEAAVAVGCAWPAACSPAASARAVGLDC